MSGPAVRVEGLGKRYRLGDKARARYGTLRDVLARLPARLAGRSPPAGDDSVWALRGVGFEVGQGEVVGLIGRNGAGKSTLLKVLSRVTDPTAGRVELRGRVGSLLEVGTGFHPELTGRKNVFLSGAVLGMGRAEVARRFDRIVAFAGTEAFLDTPVKFYSSGMYLRLGFAVAAHLDTEVLLLDEVLAVGDAAFRASCLDRMGAAAAEGRTVLLVSHDLGAVRAYCRRALCLDAGELVADGPVDEVAARYLARLRGAAGAGEGEAAFAEEPERRAQVTRVRVLGADGEPRAAHDLLEPVRVEVEFVVHRPFPSLVLRCAVLARGGETVLTSRETDWANHAGPEMGAPLPRAPGRHVAALTLPAPLLQAGVYEVRAALTVPRVEMVDERGGVFFELEDRGSFAGFPAPRRGLLALPLPWDVRPAADPDPSTR